MSTSMNKTSGKIREVKSWLSKAEQDIDNDSNLQGQMKLLIAEAELRSAQETLETQTMVGRSKYRSHLYAFGVACLLALVAFGGFWNGKLSQPNSEINNGQMPTSVTPSTISAQAVKVQEPAIVNSKEPVTAVNQTESRQEVRGVTSASTKDPAISSDEMQRLIRAAGQSLRGQNKP